MQTNQEKVKQDQHFKRASLRNGNTFTAWRRQRHSFDPSVFTVLTRCSIGSMCLLLTSPLGPGSDLTVDRLGIRLSKVGGVPRAQENVKPLELSTTIGTDQSFRNRGHPERSP